MSTLAFLILSFFVIISPLLLFKESRGFPTDEESTTNPLGIVDTGFMLTTHLHHFLAANRDWNDILAALNSFALVIPSLYVTYVTVWIGDYSLVFRVLFTQLMRSFCGWFTYLPPDPNYLASYWDFPDIVQCLFQDCSGTPKVLPFVSFFSGHVCTMVIAGNHMWLQGHTTLAVVVHALDVFQIIRLLATRGHYSIDIIIGWYMATNVSISAGRLGRYYSRGTSMQDAIPHNAIEAFETFTGVSETRNDQRMSKLMKVQEVQDMLLKLAKDDASFESVESVTTLRMVHTHVEATAKRLQTKIHEYSSKVVVEKDEKTE